MAERYDAVIVGGGHNGLTTAAYLAKAGLRTLVLERRHVPPKTAHCTCLDSRCPVSRPLDGPCAPPGNNQQQDRQRQIAGGDPVRSVSVSRISYVHQEFRCFYSNFTKETPG